MKPFFNRIFSFFNSIKSKIVFYPAVLALFGLLFAFMMIYLEELGISGYFAENMPIIMVNNGSTALTILSACIGGLISMMVFSFSMVMVLLNQAANNYSPRLLPGLISDKKHQIILGIYLSSILYCIFTLFSIQPTGDQYQLPGISILLGILSTVFCLCAFIYFIHNISQRIQINNILDHIFFSAKKRLEHLIEIEETNLDFPDTASWYSYHSEKSNYFQNLSLKNLLSICKDENTQMQVLPVKGIFVLKGMPLFMSSKKLDEKIVKKVLSNFNFSKEELVADNYTLAFKQITEIIVKAMSPAVNDPGTALNGIDYLTILFAIRMQKGDREVVTDKEEAYIRLNTINFDELMYNVMASIRTYCSHDIVIVQKLGSMFLYLQQQEAKNYRYQEVVENEIHTLLNAAQKAIGNERDLQTLSNLADKLGHSFINNK